MLSDSLLSGEGDVVLPARALGPNTRPHDLAFKQGIFGHVTRLVK